MHPLWLVIIRIVLLQITQIYMLLSWPESMLMCVISCPVTHELVNICTEVQFRDENPSSYCKWVSTCKVITSHICWQAWIQIGICILMQYEAYMDLNLLFDCQHSDALQRSIRAWVREGSHTGNIIFVPKDRIVCTLMALHETTSGTDIVSKH